jgi:hypothetical protein
LTPQAEELWYCEDGFTFCYKDVRLTVLAYDPNHDMKVYFHYKDDEREWDMVLCSVTWYYMMPRHRSRFVLFVEALEEKMRRLLWMIEDAVDWLKELFLEIKA